MKPEFIQQDFTSNFHFEGATRCNDLSVMDSSETTLRIDRSTKNLAQLRRFTNLKKLSVSSMKTDVTELLSHVTSVETLAIEFCNTGYEDLYPLSKLVNLRCLILGELRKPSSLSFLRALDALEGLELRNLRQVKELSALSDLQNLKELRIETGGMLTGQLPMNSFSPLGNLSNLQYLWLGVLSADKSLRPISKLKKLKYLGINGLFKWDEYAKLEAQLPDTECYWFKKKIIHWNLPCAKCQNESKVGLPGKGKRMVCKVCHPEKVDKLIAEHEKMFAFSLAGNW